MRKLVRPVYGMANAPRRWYCRIDGELTKLGYRMSKHDYTGYN